MATTPIQFKAPAGLSLKLELYPFGSDTLANTAGGDTATEKTNADGLYSAPVTEAITGLHDAVIVDGSDNLIATYTVFIVADDTTIYRCSDDVAGLVALPNAAAEALGGLITRGTGAGQVNQDANGRIDVNLEAISQDVAAGANLESTFDGTGYFDDTAPSTQSQLGSIANVGSPVSKIASSYVLTTGTQSANTVANVEELDEVRHEHTDVGNELDLYYQFLIGGGTPSSAIMTGYLNSNNDSLEVYGFDWVSSTWKRIGTLPGKAQSTNEVYSFKMFVDMVGSGGDEGKVRVRFTDGAFTLSSATLAIDQIYVDFSQGQEGYDNGAVWGDTNASNTNTERNIDGVATNPVSTITAVNTLLALTGLHRVQWAPASSLTFDADQTDEIHEGRDWTLALGGQNITGAFIFGAEISGVGIATGKYEFEECDIGVVTMDDAGHFERCFFEDTFTIGQAGIFTFHDCATEASGEITFDFGALGATTLHMYNFHGKVNFTNMAAGDVVHITGAGTITTTTCSGGTIDHDGFFEYTDAGNNVTQQQSDIKLNVDAILVDTDTTIPALIAALNNLSSGDVQTAAAAALVAIGLDHLLAGSVAGTDVTDNSIFAQLVSKAATADWDDFDNTTDSLEALADDVGEILTDTGTSIPATLAALPTADENAAALLDLANGVETGWTVRQIMRILAAALAGKSSGHSANSPVYRSITDAKNRISATVVADGRSAVTADGT